MSTSRLFTWAFLILVVGAGPGASALPAATAPPLIHDLVADRSPLAPHATTAVTVHASDPDGDALSFSWSASGGSISGSGSTVTWQAPAGGGDYTVSVTVTDPSQGTARESVRISVLEGLIPWPSEPPADCPFPRSDAIPGLVFGPGFSSQHFADTFYPSWGADDALYSPFTDGFLLTDPFYGLSATSYDDPPTVGWIKITGSDPRALTFADAGVIRTERAPYGGRYPAGSLHHNGVWYYGTYLTTNEGGANFNVVVDGVEINWGILGPFMGFHVSTDNGRTWTPPPWTPTHPMFGEPSSFGGKVKIGIPHFVDFGRNMGSSPDGKAYLTCHGAVDPDPFPRVANCSWITGDQIYLIRVTPSPQAINDPSQYEFFAGHDGAGTAVWTRDFNQIRPLIDWNNNCGNSSMTYNPALGRYLLTITEGWPTTARMRTYILESEKITGPFKLVTYMRDFGEEGYFVNFPSKFISGDGRTAWMWYSANFATIYANPYGIIENPPGSGYHLCMRETIFQRRVHARGKDGFIQREVWSGVGGTTIDDLLRLGTFPASPTLTDVLSSFEAPVDWAEHYGTRLRGWVIPPVSGNYRFSISGDDNCELWVSPGGDPAGKVKVASVPGWTHPREWNKYPSQQSEPIFLTGGRKVYVEALQKEHEGGDSLTVAWQLPDGTFEGPIPSSRLSLDGSSVALSTEGIVGSGRRKGQRGCGLLGVEIFLLMAAIRASVRSRSSRMGTLLVLVLFLVPVASVEGQSTPPPPAPAKGSKVHVTPEFWAEGVSVGDANRDGHADVFCGPFWYEGPRFTDRHELYPARESYRRAKSGGSSETVRGFKGFLSGENGYSDNFLSFTGDLNGDGWVDYIVVGHPGEAARWYENPKGKGGLRTRHPVLDRVDNESPAFVDVDGDGKPELICMNGGNLGYVVPDPQRPGEPWKWQPVTTGRSWKWNTHGLGTGDINGDGRIDLITSLNWWEQPASPESGRPWKQHDRVFSDGGAQMFAYDVNGDGRADVITSYEGHGYGLLWHEQTFENGQVGWIRHTIAGKTPEEGETGVVFSQRHAVDLADLNGDGLLDIVTGKRVWAHGPKGDAEPNAPAVLYAFELRRENGKARFVACLIDDDSGVGTQVRAADLNNDGKPDIVVGNKKGVFVHLQR